MRTVSVLLSHGMLSLTRKTDYGLVALGLLAQRRRSDGGPISAAQIAQRFDLPRALLCNILKELSQARVVAATRGASGGYELAMAPERVSLLEVIQALEGPVKLTECADGLPIVGQGCSLEAGCPIRRPIRRLNGRIQRMLETLTLADLLDEADEASAGGGGECCHAAGPSLAVSGAATGVGVGVSSGPG
jgi:Rrf2 family protein